MGTLASCWDETAWWQNQLQDDSMRFWAQFSCFKLEKQAWPHIMEPNSLILVQVAEEHEWFVAGPSFF